MVSWACQAETYESGKVPDLLRFGPPPLRWQVENFPALARGSVRRMTLLRRLRSLWNKAGPTGQRPQQRRQR